MRKVPSKTSVKIVDRSVWTWVGVTKKLNPELKKCCVSPCSTQPVSNYKTYNNISSIKMNYGIADGIPLLVAANRTVALKRLFGDLGRHRAARLSGGVDGAGHSFEVGRQLTCQALHGIL